MIQRYDVKQRSDIPQILEILPPDAEPLGIQDYLNYASLKIKGQKDLFADKLVDARVQVENYTGRALITRTVDQIVDYDPKNNPTGIPLYMTGAVGEIQLRLPPVRKINQVTVYDPFRNPTLVDPSVYQLLFVNDPYSTLIVTLGHVWPGILSDIQSIRIRCICGYATLISAIDATADTITAPNHPYSNDDVFRLTMKYGEGAEAPSAPVGLQVRKNYYIINVSGDTFQVSATQGGSPIDITSEGSGNLYAGEIPAPLLRGVVATAAFNFLQEEYDETSKPIMGLHPSVQKMLRRYKRRYI